MGNLGLIKFDFLINRTDFILFFSFLLCIVAVSDSNDSDQQYPRRYDAIIVTTDLCDVQIFLLRTVTSFYFCFSYFSLFLANISLIHLLMSGRPCMCCDAALESEHVYTAQQSHCHETKPSAKQAAKSLSRAIAVDVVTVLNFSIY